MYSEVIKGVCREAEPRVAAYAERKIKELMPANLLASSSVLSGAVFSMLLLWLLCSALMTLRVGAKQHQAGTTPAPAQKGAQQTGQPEVSGLRAEPARVGLPDPLPDAELVEMSGASALSITEGQLSDEQADPEIAFLAASAE
jgi:hypothetical protein